MSFEAGHSGELPNTIDWNELKVEVAAQDSDLTAFYEYAIHGTILSVEEKRAALIEDMTKDDELEMRADIKREYGLSDAELTKAINRCVARVAGLQRAVELLPED